MRNRAWRRYMEELVIIRRLTYINRLPWYRGLETANGHIIKDPRFIDYIGTKNHFDSKTIKTTKWETKTKLKFSPNKSKGYYRDYKETNTREFVRKEFLKILKENGIK